MKRSVAMLAIVVSVLFTACKGNPQGAMGANDKPDSTAFDREDNATGRPEATKKDSTVNTVGPGSDKSHATDSESEKKH